MNVWYFCLFLNYQQFVLNSLYNITIYINFKMLLTEGFLGWLSRFKGMGGWVGGGMGGWPVCEAWVDGVMGLRVGFINIKRYVQ
jgi:hypothetical protein